jgi:hypothetical protein
MPSDLTRWEKAYLGKGSLLMTGVFWDCVIAMGFALSFIYFAATHLRAVPRLRFLAVPFSTIAVTALFLVALNFFKKAKNAASLVRGAIDNPEQYQMNLQIAKSVTVGFVRATLAIGCLIALLLTIVSIAT